MKRELPPVPAGYNGITDECIRSNATTRIIWHGRDAEALQMQHAKEYLAEGCMVGVENCLRSIMEIRRQLEADGESLLQRHYECARLMAEGERREAERKRAIEIGAAPRPVPRRAVPSDADSIKGPKVYTLRATGHETTERAIALAGISPAPEDSVIVIRIFGEGPAPEHRLVSIHPKVEAPEERA
jgi:hypothetical protein